MMMKLITLTLLMTSIGCIKFDSPSSEGTDEGGGVSVPTKSTVVDAEIAVGVEAVLRKLPAVFEPSLSAHITFDNVNNVNLRDVHLTVSDSSSGTFYSGNALGLKNLANRGIIKLGREKYVTVYQIRGGSESQIEYKIKNKKLEIVIF